MYVTHVHFCSNHLPLAVKKRAYEQRVREIEHVSFIPIVMSATGGLAKEATNFYRRLASLLAEKWDQPYSSTLHWLRCSISFSVLRSSIRCIRGARSSRGHPIKLSPVDLVSAEASLQPLTPLETPPPPPPLQTWFTLFHSFFSSSPLASLASCGKLQAHKVTGYSLLINYS